MLLLSHILQALVDFLLKSKAIDVNIRNGEGEGPIHKIVKKKRKERVDLLIALLTNSNADVHFATAKNMTALHLAVEVRVLGSNVAPIAMIAHVVTKKPYTDENLSLRLLLCVCLNLLSLDNHHQGNRLFSLVTTCYSYFVHIPHKADRFVANAKQKTSTTYLQCVFV